MNTTLALGCFVLCVIQIGCTTMRKVVDPDLPAVYMGRFDSCDAGEGWGRMSLKRGARQISSEFEWLLKGRFQARLTNPFGQTILDISRDNNGLRKKGTLSLQWPEIDVNEQGFFLVDGQWIGVRFDEMICLLKQKWPHDWLGKVVGSKPMKTGYLISAQDEGRIIRLVLKGQSAGCASFSWNAFWFFAPQKITACLIEGQSRLVVDFSDYRLIWDREP